jgi:hypothetical protein
MNPWFGYRPQHASSGTELNLGAWSISPIDYIAPICRARSTDALLPQVMGRNRRATAANFNTMNIGKSSRPGSNV